MSSAKSGAPVLPELSLEELVAGGVACGAPVAPRSDWDGEELATGVPVAPRSDWDGATVGAGVCVAAGAVTVSVPWT
jgi:hypothetical protein